MGFQPKGELDPRYVEYYKDFAEAHGRMARCTILFSKGGPVMNMDQARLEQFVVTVQGTVDPVPEEVVSKAPPVMHEDMLHALQTLEGLNAAGPAAVETYRCDNCHNTTAEFVVSKQGNKLCRPCFKRLGVSASGEG